MPPKVDHETLSEVLAEIKEQPAWRHQADREMDYCDGNQLDSDILEQLKAKGIPPSIENLIGPALEDIVGMEALNRTDWRVEADGDKDEESDAVARAMGFKLNAAERRSGADRALTRMYASLSKVGTGWVEVSRESDPFKFPYRVQFVHRNEIWRDWYRKNHDLSDARWLLRRRWSHVNSAIAMFPKHKDLILNSSTGWSNVDDIAFISEESGSTTDLAQSLDIERGWSIEEQEWRDPANKRVCFFQLLTKDTQKANILKMRGGRVVEFDLNNPMHILAVQSGVPIEKANINKIYNTFFIGPHVLESKQSEFSRFNFVEAVGKEEDRTKIPYGIIRWLMYLQDEVNARVSKMQWLLGATRTVRTQGAALMEDNVLRNEIGRPDADIILDQAHMALPGAKFEISNDMALNDQQAKRLEGLYATFDRIVGRNRQMVNGKLKEEISDLLHNASQTQATLNDNFGYARQQVGDLLVELIAKDIGDKQHEVTIGGNGLKKDETIVLNTPQIDEASGVRLLTNDVSRTMLKVTLSEVPSTDSYRKQELASMSEFAKSLPEEYRVTMAPYMVALSSSTYKDEIIRDIQAIKDSNMLSPEQVAEKIKEAIEQERVKWMVEQKTRDLDIKERKTDAEIEKIAVENVLNRVETSFSAVATAVQALVNRQVAPIADQIMRSSGAVDQDQPPIIAAPQVSPEAIAPQPVQQNTSPMFPPRVQEPDIEEEMPSQVGEMPEPDEGINNGIEAGGVQI